MGKFISIPTKLLLETGLRPTSKVIYALLVKESDMNGVSTSTIKTLQKGLTTQIGSESQVLNEEAVKAHIKALEEVGYIKVLNNTPKLEIQLYDEPKQEVITQAVQGTLFSVAEPPKRDGLAARRKKYSADILDIMHYVSNARICRGYSDSETSGLTHENTILRALEKGYTAKDLKALANLLFETDWYKNKPELLTPSSMYKPAQLEKWVPTLTQDSIYRNTKIVEFGLDSIHEVVYNDKSKGSVIF